MTTFTLTIDGHPVEACPGQTILDAARQLGLDIPTLCYLEKCGPLNSCLVCLVKVNGKLVPSCGTKAQPGMVVESETTEVHEARRTALELLFSDHVGDCLAPCHRLCPLGMNIPVMIRHIQTMKLEEAADTVRDALALPGVLGRLCHHPCEQGCRRGSLDDSAGIREMERFVADTDAQATQTRLPACRKPTGKSAAIIGAGPTGLAAAYHLLRQGHSCTIFDRHDTAGGTLRIVDETLLPRSVLAAETRRVAALGAQFRLGAAVGRDLPMDDLVRDFDAVLVAAGELPKMEGEALGLEMAPGGVKIDPETYQTSRPAVFAAGRAVKPMTQLVRAMSEGLAAAQRIHFFLLGKRIQRVDRPFSSIMGRLDKSELQVFLKGANPAPSVMACDACAGLTKREAATEASRCLHCDCRSSGDCALQSYAQIYEADASRYRQQRKAFEQIVQPGGVIFEPGKCILCGICVKLTEMAREPLGLAFVGRGFDVRVATPFNRGIAEGLQKVAEECVRYCPTGALVLAERRE
jgi:NADPH-dependent glutamate synthase beta subunit-like oxidoreductase/ferredoxin